jgi:tellurite resistance protein
LADVKDAIRGASRTLEEQFFKAREEALLQKMKAERAREGDREHLGHITGIEDLDLLDRLLNQGLHAETLVALSLAPMVEVAWADGEVDPKEHAEVTRLAAEHGLESPGTELLEGWLNQRPGPELLPAWTEFARHLCEQMEPKGRDRLRAEVMTHATLVAKASGGVLGIGAICAEERAVLKKLEDALRVV